MKMLLMLAACSILLACISSAQSWQTVSTQTNGAYGLSITVELQVDISTINSSTSKIRMNIFASGTPTAGSSAYVAFTTWASETPGSGSFLGGNVITSFPSSTFGSPQVLPTGTARSIDASVQSVNPAAGEATAHWTITGTVPPPPTYSADFPIPANNSGRKIYYFVRQGASIVLAYAQADGEGASVLHATGLAASPDAQLFRQDGGDANVDPHTNSDGSVTLVYVSPGEGATVTAVGSAVTPGSNSSPPSGSTAPTIPYNTYTPQTPQAPPVSPPTPSPTVTAPAVTTATPAAPVRTPSVTPAPFFSPFNSTVTTDTTAADRATVAQSANAVVDALSQTNQNLADHKTATVQGFNDVTKSIVDTGNNTVTAIDKTTKAVNDGHNATITAINNANTQGTKNTNGIINAVNDVKSAIENGNGGGQAAVNAGNAAAASSGAAQGSQIGSNVTSAQSSANGTISSLNSGPLSGFVSIAGTNPIIGDDGYATTPHVVSVSSNGPILNAVAPSGLDTNPFTSPTLGSLIGSGTALIFTTWIKRVIEWCSIVAFFTWTAGQVRQNCFAMTTASPIPLPASSDLLSRTTIAGNSVGVIPAGTLYGLQVIAISTLILSAPVIIVSAFSAAGATPALTTAGVNAASSAVSGLGSFVSHALSFMYLILPVLTLLTIFVNALLVRVASITQFVITAVVIKILNV